MALNYSAHTTEDNMWSPMRRVSGYLSEGVSEMNGEGGRREFYGWQNVYDLLPSNPFGMKMENTSTAIMGGFFSDWNNFIWSPPSTFQPLSSRISRANQKTCGVTNEISSCDVQEKMEGAAKFEGIPFEALLSILNFLGVKDLLSVERVCKSFCSTIRSEPWLWRSIHIESPLNERITDDSLSRLVSRAGGGLQRLSLVECPKVTDDGIRRILEMNPQLTKLSVPGCTRLTVEGTLNNIKIHNANKGGPGIKQLRIGQLFGVTREHFRELNSLLGLHGVKPENHHKAHFYHGGNFYLPFEDDRAMDIDMCPRCEEFRLVYNCPAEGCQVKESGVSQVCLACSVCIPRCTVCGVCISDNEYMETFCLDLNCSDCYKQSQV